MQTRPKLDVIVVMPPARRMFRASHVSPGSRRCVGREVLDGCQKNSVGSECEDRLHSSASRVVYQECHHNRENFSFEEGLTERSRLGHADAYVLHKPGWARPQFRATSRTRKSKTVAFKKDRAPETIATTMTRTTVNVVAPSMPCARNHDARRKTDFDMR